jgi:hypothetical protein
MRAALLLTVFVFTAPFHPAKHVYDSWGREIPNTRGTPDLALYLRNPMTVEVWFDERQHTITPIWGIWNVECQPRIVQAFVGIWPGEYVVYDDGWKCMFGTLWVVTVSPTGARSAPSNLSPARLVYFP